MAINSLATAQKWVELASSSPTSGTTVTFSSLAEYKDYRIEWFGLTNSGGENFAIRFNNDSGNNYAYWRSDQSDSASTSLILSGNSQIQCTILNANSISKTIEGFSSFDGQIRGFWNNQSVIDRIDISTQFTATFTAGTIKIYGRN